MPWVTGSLLVLASRWIHHRFPGDPALGPLILPLFEAGLAFFLLALWPAREPVRGLITRVSLLVLSVGVAVGLLEAAFRALDFDFRGQDRAWRRLPPYARQATVPTGTVYFRRPGPETWTGQVLRSSLELRGWPVPEVYRDEPIITVTYDSLGFRAARPLDDWEIAVAGDSFTELGYLPDEQLFTTLLANRTRTRVRNLGVSGTGPFTQLSYLRDYGRSRSLRDAVIVFFEGNDPADLEEECLAADLLATTGKRPFRDIVPQDSLLVALADLGAAAATQRRPDPGIPLLYEFRTPTGSIPVHLPRAPLQRRTLPAGTSTNLERFVREFRDFGREQHARTWLAYVPSKARVLHPRLVPIEVPRNDDGLWWPKELPDLVGELCRRYEVRFVDLTPTLERATVDRGELVYNSLYDIHLNARGSELVAEELARALGTEPAARPDGDGP